MEFFLYTEEPYKGEIFSGEYKDDKRNGKGMYKYRNGDVYIGEWNDDVKGAGQLIKKENQIQNISNQEEEEPKKRTKENGLIPRYNSHTIM